VLGLEFLTAGYSRLHFWKDRDGDLPIGSKLGLLFDRERGFMKDPRAVGQDDSAEQLVQVLTAFGTRAATVAELAAALGVSPDTARRRLTRLPEGMVTEGPPAVVNRRKAATYRLADGAPVVDPGLWD